MGVQILYRSGGFLLTCTYILVWKVRISCSLCFFIIYRARGDDSGGSKETEEAMGARKKRRFISKAFVDSSDESDLDEQSVHVEASQEVREGDEGGDSEEWRVQDPTITMSGNSSIDRSGYVQCMQTDILLS